VTLPLFVLLWRLVFVGMYHDPGVLVEKELLEWRQFVDECGLIADPNDKAAALLCAAFATCGLDNPLSAACRYESALVAADNSAVSQRWHLGARFEPEWTLLQGYWAVG
jgi:hypothetical protein